MKNTANPPTELCASASSVWFTDVTKFIISVADKINVAVSLLCLQICVLTNDAPAGPNYFVSVSKVSKSTDLNAISAREGRSITESLTVIRIILFVLIRKVGMDDVLVSIGVTFYNILSSLTAYSIISTGNAVLVKCNGTLN